MEKLQKKKVKKTKKELKEDDPYLNELKNMKRKELFQKAHEVGLKDFAQFSNTKLVKEIYKRK